MSLVHTIRFSLLCVSLPNGVSEVLSFYVSCSGLPSSLTAFNQSLLYSGCFTLFKVDDLLERFYKGNSVFLSLLFRFPYAVDSFSVLLRDLGFQ